MDEMCQCDLSMQPFCLFARSCSSCRMLQLWCSSSWRHKLTSMTLRMMTHRSAKTKQIMDPETRVSLIVLLSSSCASRSPTWSRHGRACVRSWGRSSSSTCLWWWVRWWRPPPSNLKWLSSIVRVLFLVHIHTITCYYYNGVSLVMDWTGC